MAEATAGGKDRYRHGVADRTATTRRTATVLVTLAVALTSAGTARSAPADPRYPVGPTERGFVVTRVVDGDTVHVERDGVDLTVRLIGINAPESVKPNAPVECFGPQSSAFAKARLTGRRVLLEFDPSQGRTDQYGRTLAYVWIEQPGGAATMFNRTAVLAGFARERQYGPRRPLWKPVLSDAQAQARRARAGLWGACPWPTP